MHMHTTIMTIKAATDLLIVVIYVSLAVLAQRLLIPFIPGMEVVKMKVFSWSFEPLCDRCWLVTLLLNMEIPLDIVRSFMSGNLQAELAKAGFYPLWSMHWLLQPISCSGWSFTECFTGVSPISVPSSALGPWRYFKERTWLERFLRFANAGYAQAWICSHRQTGKAGPARSSEKQCLQTLVILACISPVVVLGHRRADPLLYCIILPAEEILGKVPEKYHRLL